VELDEDILRPAFTARYSHVCEYRTQLAHDGRSALQRCSLARRVLHNKGGVRVSADDRMYMPWSSDED
jgi:hypothetical protein